MQRYSSNKIFWLHVLTQVLVLVGHIRVIPLGYLSSKVAVHAKPSLKTHNISVIGLHLHGVVELRVVSLLILSLSRP